MVKQLLPKHIDVYNLEYKEILKKFLPYHVELSPNIRRKEYYEILDKCIQLFGDSLYAKEKNIETQSCDLYNINGSWERWSTLFMFKFKDDALKFKLMFGGQ